LPPLRALIFDMDGTLYQSAALDRRYAQSLYTMVATSKKIPLPEARRLFQERHEALARRLGTRPSKLFTLQAMGISDERWAQEAGSCIHPADVLKRDPRLRRLLLALRRNFRLAVVTNNHRENTEETLDCLGITDCFDEIGTLSESRRFKPSPQLYRDMARRLGVDPAECLSIGDRVHLDLEPAAAVGMQTFWVRRAADLYRLPRVVRPAGAVRRAALRRMQWPAVVREAARVLKAGRLAVVPTDTVYGLAAMPAPEAVRWIYRAKGRDEGKPLVLLLADAAAASRVAKVSSRARALMKQHWPGGLTLVLPVKPRTPWGRITRGDKSVAVRVPDHELLRAIIRRCGGVLATTSANVSGEPARASAAGLDTRLAAFVHLLIDAGPSRVKVPSTVARVQGARVEILRPGAVQIK
jgi:L-threonylcarbamoyladenylate synthase